MFSRHLTPPCSPPRPAFPAFAGAGRKHGRIRANGDSSYFKRMLPRPPCPAPLSPSQVLDENTAAAGGMCANYNSTSNTLLVVS